MPVNTVAQSNFLFLLQVSGNVGICCLCHKVGPNSALFNLVCTKTSSDIWFSPWPQGLLYVCLFANFRGGKKYQPLHEGIWKSLIFVSKSGMISHIHKNSQSNINLCQKVPFYAKNTAGRCLFSPSLVPVGELTRNLQNFFLHFESWHIFPSQGAEFRANPCLLTAWEAI